MKLLELLGYSKPIPLHDHTDSRRTLRAIEYQKSGNPLGDPTLVTYVAKVTSADERARKTERLLAVRRGWAGAAAAILLALLPPLAAPAIAQVHLCGHDLCNGANVISHPQPPGKAVYQFRVSPDGARAIYVSNSDCRRELYSVATAGGPAVKISDLSTTVQSPCFLNVTDEIAISPDGKWATWEADRDRDQDYELFSTPIAGGPTVQLNPPLPFDNDVEHHRISCDSAHVVYRQGKDSANRWELWSAPIRSPMAARRISQVMGMSQAVGAFLVGCDGLVDYWADLTQSGSYSEWTVGVTGVPPPTAAPAGLPFVDGFEGGSTGAWR